MIKKYSLATVLFTIFCLLSNLANAKNEIQWAIFEQPYMATVNINKYNGDNLEAGKYKAEVKYSKSGTAELFYIIVSEKKLSVNNCISIIRDQFSDSFKASIKVNYKFYVVGGASNDQNQTPFSETIELNKGQYVFVIPDKYYSLKRNLSYSGNTLGVFSLSKILH
jgi:hypothetical protein